MGELKPFIGVRADEKTVNEVRTNILDADEQLEGLFSGTAIDDWGRAKGIRASYLVITDRRVMIWARAVLKGMGTEGFLYPDIRSVEVTKGLVLGRIILNLGGAKEVFDNMQKGEIDMAANMIREHVQRARMPQPPQPTPQVTPHDDIPEQIKKLAELRDAGILSEDEFNAKKKELLARM